ncbi:beta-galactosidase [Litoreibacter ponti]|uniref:Beta-galactosidase n=1 Tax=Litoreibacter ponti TaxID=1510457 RepID=A0A2T6BFL8_9RHOB|nr:beta-galactosidase [Litoreibacter ponti]PTX54858.1 beta-galactosidase [Litoreibacter ponti]
MKRTLGVCYYPEHWPEDLWPEDAARMVEAGLSWVRIGEFAWSRLEPSPGNLQLDWLDRAIKVLGNAGLKVILGTPTATPPRWMADKHPDMFARDAGGHVRGFGSRRHYCFSHQGYRAESRRITEILAKRYGANPHVAAWQTDNEYGCHDTVLSYSDAALAGFRDWLSQKYQSPDALNRAWGNIFWSMEYASFDEIGLPNLTVTEPNPAHVMDFRRYSSDQVVAFNRDQTEILRRHTDAPLIHNYMGRVTEFDHFDVGADLDIASWDSYPLGFLEDRMEDSDAHKRSFAQQGDPDFQAFHHDLYRAVGRGRWWIMEQQPGPVNWAPVNPAPLPGMCRLWAWEAFAHGAETVCYFRWRQAPFAQEQMHAGLLRPDSVAAPALGEAADVAREIAAMPDVGTVEAKVALIFDYPSNWAWEVQPQGSAFSYFRLVFETYRTLRSLGLDIDVVAPSGVLQRHKLVLAPGVFSGAQIPDDCRVILGPRCNSKTPDFKINASPIPGVTVSHVESFRADMPRALPDGGAMIHWQEHLETTLPVHETSAIGEAVLVGGRAMYLAAWLDFEALRRVFRTQCEACGITTVDLPEGLRLRRTQTHQFVFNYGRDPVSWRGQNIAPAGVYWTEL